MMRRFVVLRVSVELLEIAQDLPEVLTTSGMWLDGKRVAGPEMLLETEDEEKLRNSFKSLRDRCEQGQNIIILEQKFLR